MEAGESVIITGGHGTPRTVSRYNAQGWEEDIAELNTGRWDHGCASFYKDNAEV